MNSSKSYISNRVYNGIRKLSGERVELLKKRFMEAIEEVGLDVFGQTSLFGSNRK